MRHSLSEISKSSILHMNSLKFRFQRMNVAEIMVSKTGAPAIG